MLKKISFITLFSLLVLKPAFAKEMYFIITQVENSILERTGVAYMGTGNTNGYIRVWAGYKSKKEDEYEMDYTIVYKETSNKNNLSIEKLSEDKIFYQDFRAHYGWAVGDILKVKEMESKYFDSTDISSLTIKGKHLKKSEERAMLTILENYRTFIDVRFRQIGYDVDLFDPKVIYKDFDCQNINQRLHCNKEFSVVYKMKY